jgi:hypothetical protein
MIQSLGPLLAELQAVLQAKGCRVTEMSVTFYPTPDDSVAMPVSVASEPAAICEAVSCPERASSS